MHETSLLLCRSGPPTGWGDLISSLPPPALLPNAAKEGDCMDVHENTTTSAALLDAAPNLLGVARERELSARELMRVRVWMGQLWDQADRLLFDRAPGPWRDPQDFDRKAAIGYGRHVGERRGCYYLLQPDGRGQSDFVEVECTIVLRGSMGLLIPHPTRQRTLGLVRPASTNPDMLVILALMTLRPTMEIVTLCGLDVRSRAFGVIREFVGSWR